MPTLTEAAGLAAPVRTDGVSLLPELTGKPGQKKSLVYVEYFQNGRTPDYSVFDSSHQNRKRGQMQMLRLGDTVCVRYDIKSPDDDFEIYNVVSDPKQIHDLAKTQDMSKLEKYLKGRVLQMHLANSSAPRPYDSLLIPADEIHDLKNGWKVISYQSATPWIAECEPNQKFSKSFQNGLSIQNKNENTSCFEGYIKVPSDGKYTFRLQANGKAFLRVHEIALIDEDYGYKPGEMNSQILFLKKGFHKIRLYYMKNQNKNPSLKLEWAKDGGPFSDISKDIYSNQ